MNDEQIANEVRHWPVCSVTDYERMLVYVGHTNGDVIDGCLAIHLFPDELPGETLNYILTHFWGDTLETVLYFTLTVPLDDVDFLSS